MYILESPGRWDVKQNSTVQAKRHPWGCLGLHNPSRCQGNGLLREAQREPNAKSSGVCSTLGAFFCLFMQFHLSA